MTVATSPGAMTIRDADASELDALAELWFIGWQDAHIGILPAELARLRTRASFRERLTAMLRDIRVAGPAGTPLGLAITKGDELYQLYVAAAARGSGLARLLIDDALDRLRARGVATAWLACAIGNERAARFYEKSGWRRTGIVTSRLPTPNGIFPLDVWRYEIALRV